MRILIIILGMLCSFHASANAPWNSQFDDWRCHGKAGVIEEIHQIDSYTDNIMAEEDRIYDLLCTFIHKFEINNQKFSLRILFPNCVFSSENQLITTKLSIDAENNTAILLEDNSYQISFPPKTTYFTGAEINQDQNVKMVFFNAILLNDIINLNIQNIGAIDIKLNGLQQGMQRTYCNK
jgi:hypothetical protein